MLSLIEIKYCSEYPTLKIFNIIDGLLQISAEFMAEFRH